MNREQYEIQKIVDRQRAFQEAIAPILREKVKVMSMYVPSILIHADGRVEQGPPPDWAATLLAQYDEIIKIIASSLAASGATQHFIRQAPGTAP